MVDACGLGDVLGKDIGQLSKGFRQRVGLAQAMVHDPEILILDEPTSGLDPNQIADIRHLIRELGKEKTLILSTHILPEVQATCDRVIIIADGTLVADDTVEAAVVDAIGRRPFDSLLDLGTGTGRMLELLHPLYARAIGIDASPNMLSVARANLDRAGIGEAQVRLGDIYNLTLPRDSFDVVTVHLVLHFLDDPERALAEAARVLRPGGRLLIVDFAPHELEFLREEHAHRRLGFGREQVAQWLAAPGLAIDEIRELPTGDSDKLKVTLWLARDQRFIVADGGDREVA